MPKSVFTDAYASFRVALIAARKSAHVSQVDLAARLGKTQSFVSQVERGVRRVDVVEFYAIAKALEIDPTRFFDDVTRGFPDNVAI